MRPERKQNEKMNAMIAKEKFVRSKKMKIRQMVFVRLYNLVYWTLNEQNIHQSTNWEIPPRGITSRSLSSTIVHHDDIMPEAGQVK